MSRDLHVAAAQLGPIQKSDSRTEVVARLIELLRQAHSKKAELVVFPELALTTFFPRWFVDDITEADHWYETEMPSKVTQPLFDEAKKLQVGFCLGYAELTATKERFNTQILLTATAIRSRNIARCTFRATKSTSQIDRFNMLSVTTSLQVTKASEFGKLLVAELE